MPLQRQWRRHTATFKCRRCPPSFNVCITVSGPTLGSCKRKVERVGWMTWPEVLCPHCHRRAST